MNIDLFSGRLSNKNFFIQVVVFMVCCGIFVLISQNLHLQFPTWAINILVVFWFVILFILPVYYLSMVARRLHDLGHSGMWSLAIFGSLMFGAWVDVIFGFGIILFGIIILNIIVFACLVGLKGNKGKNKYGSPN